MRTAAVVLTVVALALLAGCRTKSTGTLHEMSVTPDYERPLPEGQLALRKITDPREIPDFTPACYDLTNLRQAVAYSLDYMSKPSSQKYFPYLDITHDRAVASLKAFDALLASGLPPAEMNRAIREQFDVYISVGCDNKGTVLFTGYYTPIFNGSPVRTPQFQYPLYKAPAGLVKADDGTTVGVRMPDGQMVRCPTREQIDSSGMLAGTEVAWLADPFEVYVAHVQGSVKLRMPDQRIVDMGYAANNGYDYVSVSKALVNDGKIPAKDISLQAMMDYFRAHPEQVRSYINRNPRYVFFTPGGDGPRGSLNEPVTSLRTIATDKSIFPRASVAFLATSLPRQQGNGIVNVKYSGFALDQDTGKAIRAAGRSDVYIGVGDQAGELAGRTMQEGKLYYLFLKTAPSVAPTNAPMASYAPAPAAGYPAEYAPPAPGARR